MQTKAKVLVALAAALVGATALLWTGLGESVDVQARATWPAGLTRDYRLEWTAKSELATGAEGESFASTIDLVATLRLVGAGPRDGGWLVAASFVDVPKPNVELMGRAALEHPEELVGPRAWVTLAADGRVERIYFDAQSPQAFKHLMQNVVGLAHVTSGDGESWRAVEPGPSGIARVEYRRAGASWTRARLGYDKITAAPAMPKTQPVLAARAAISVDDSGHVTKLVDDESLVVNVNGSATPLFRGTSRFALTLIDGRTAAAPVTAALENLEARAPGELVQSGDVERALREQRVAGLTREELVFGLTRVWAGPGVDKRNWMDRAVALVQLHPELCADVVAAFADGNTEAKLFAFDLLAAVGHDEAQAAMREAFALASGLEVELVQRFSFVQRPNAETAAFVLATVQSGDANLVAATRFTMGALVRHGAPNASAINAQLRESLASAKSQTEREHLLAALGNTALVENVPVLREQARDAAPEIRARAAWALRDMAVQPARDALVELAQDADPRVARSALKAMTRQTLGAHDLASLATTLRGPLADATVASLIDLLTLNLEGGAPVRQLLETLAARESNTHLQARARVLLAQIN